MNDDTGGVPQSGSQADFAETQVHSTDSSASELVRVLDEYLAQLQAGERPDRQQFLDAHPQLAPQLEECLGGLEFVHRTSQLPAETPAVLGDFRIIREVGRGGMGVVYEAEQISLKRRVALKVLRFGGVADSEAVLRFQREAETAAHLEHGHIVPVYAVGQHEDVHYFAMQFIDGVSLAAVELSQLEPSAARGTSRFPQQIAEWGLTAAEALAHAHQQGVVHRDVKPSNLILDHDGRLWLTDFGLARRDIDATLSIAGALLGTPRYMSPEQAGAASKPIDHRTDIYSLGATLYELATGQPVFEAETPQGVITQILYDEPPAPRRLDPQLPGDLETIILKCLQKEAADRYATASDLAEDLQAFLDDRPIRARRAGPVERSRRWLRRHQKMARAAALSAVVAGLIAIGVPLIGHHYREARMGGLDLTTSGSQMVGEILNESGETVVSSFSVPTVETLKLPPGSYSLRLSSDGLLSETWPIEISQGEVQSLPVEFRSRWLWPPHELDSRNHTQVELIGARVANAAGPQEAPERSPGGGYDLILIGREDRQTPGGRRTRIRRIDGRSGRDVWEDSLVVSPATIPDGRASDGWLELFDQAGPMFSDQRRSVHPAVDLDGDGLTDPVFLSRAVPSLLAISGRDGRLLWWHRGRPRVETNAASESTSTESAAEVSGKWGISNGTIMGTPLVHDVDQDGVADFIVCCFSRRATFHPQSGPSQQVPQQSWVAAVSGQSGQLLWQHVLTQDLSGVLTDSDQTESLHRGCRIQLAHVDGQDIVTLVVSDQVIGLDPSSGLPQWEPFNLGHGVFDFPSPLSLSSNARDGLLCTVRDKNSDDLQIVTISIAALLSDQVTEAQLWNRSARPADRVEDLWTGQSDWCLTEDLDGDDRTDMVCSQTVYDYERGLQESQNWSGVRRLDAATGDVVWERRLTQPALGQPPDVESLVSGPDLDGDGCREVFACWRGRGGAESWESQIRLKVVALSGCDGRTLWRWHDSIGRGPHSSRRDIRPSLTWWQPGSDGWPMLVVPITRGRGGQSVTYFLSAATGQLQHVLTGATDLACEDLDDDGISDLVYRVHPQGEPRLLAVKGTLSEPWKRLGNWSLVGDVNQDGHDDLINRSNLAVASGDDGGLLWQMPQAAVRRQRTDSCVALPLPAGDLNQDGVPDLFMFASRDDGRGGLSDTVGAFSGADGSVIWVGDAEISLNGGGSGSTQDWNYSYPYLGWADVDQDGLADALAITMHNNQSTHGRWMLTVWSGRNGQSMWQHPVAPGSVGLVNDPSDRRYPDLNGDGVGDPVLYVAVGAEAAAAEAPAASSSAGRRRQSDTAQTVRRDRQPRYELQAIDGASGEFLWAQAAVSLEHTDMPLWPRPAVGDLNADGIPEVVIVRRASQPAEGNPQTQLVVFSGHDGAQLWSVPWDTSNQILPPLLVDFEGDGRQTICVGLIDGDAQVVFLDDQGAIQNRIKLGPGSAFAAARAFWRAADFDQDGRDELVIRIDDQIRLIEHPEGSVQWSWSLPDQRASLVFDPHQTRTGEVVVWSGQTVYGLDAETGQPRWICEGPYASPGQNSSGQSVWLLDRHQRDAPPRVLFGSQRYQQSFATVVQQAIAVDAQGRLILPAPRERKYADLGNEPLQRRPLPWMNARQPSLLQHLECLLIPSGLVTVLVILIPWWLSRLVWHSTQLSTALTLVAVLAAYAAFCTLGPLPQAASSFVALGLPCLLIWRSQGQRSRADAVVGVTAMVLLAIPLVIVHSFQTRILAQVHAWGSWYWVDELLFEPLVVALVAGMPGYLFWHALWTALRKGDAQLVRRLLIWATLIACGLAAALLLIVGIGREPLTVYSANGWYIIWFWGAFVVGLLVGLGAVLELCAHWKLRFKRRREAVSAGT